VGENYDRAARRETREELGIPSPTVEKLYSYIWMSDRESEMVRTYLCRYEGEFALDREELETGRYWTLEEIESSLGSGVFTPNFEEEFARFSAWKKEQKTPR